MSSGICLWGFHKDLSFFFLTERGSIKGERQNPFHWPLALLTLERTPLCLFPAYISFLLLHYYLHRTPILLGSHLVANRVQIEMEVLWRGQVTGPPPFFLCPL